jgi:hypothetical protein
MADVELENSVSVKNCGKEASMSEEYPVLYLIAVFWEGPDAKDGVDAIAHVEDALIVYLTRPDGLQVRLTVYELELLYNFVTGEVLRQDEENSTTDLANGVSAGRMAGCQSTNHTECYGELWQCEKCGKTVCCAEGSSHDPDLCDDCWAEKYARGTTLCPPEDDVPF